MNARVRIDLGRFFSSVPIISPNIERFLFANPSRSGTIFVHVHAWLNIICDDVNPPKHSRLTEVRVINVS